MIWLKSSVATAAYQSSFLCHTARTRICFERIYVGHNTAVCHGRWLGGFSGILLTARVPPVGSMIAYGLWTHIDLCMFVSGNKPYILRMKRLLRKLRLY